jgi:hypothetical protein
MSNGCSWLIAAAVSAAGCQHATRFVEDPTVLAGRHPPPGDELFGNFAGRIPCDKCDKIKITLSLFQRRGSPTTYQLERVGEDGNARITTRGTWTRTVGAPADLNAAVVRLDDQTPRRFSRYLVFGGNLLLMLDQHDELLVGNGAWNYTLSRVDVDRWP